MEEAPAIHPPDILLKLYYGLPAVRRVWFFATVVMYIERSEREAKDPHGSFARSPAALVQHNLHCNQGMSQRSLG
jgi:hypothetical protein